MSLDDASKFEQEEPDEDMHPPSRDEELMIAPQEETRLLFAGVDDPVPYMRRHHPSYLRMIEVYAEWLEGWNRYNDGELHPSMTKESMMATEGSEGYFWATYPTLSDPNLRESAPWLLMDVGSREQGTRIVRISAGLDDGGPAVLTGIFDWEPPRVERDDGKRGAYAWPEGQPPVYDHWELAALFQEFDTMHTIVWLADGGFQGEPFNQQPTKGD